MFDLNDEEIRVLKVIKDLNDRNEKTDYYQVVSEAQGDTGKMIPVVGRLEDEGYVKSNGVIFRYFKITEKGLKKLEERNK
ncbi:MAG: hypothetical protein GX076_09330 [Clostridiales bacterium]|nr:hypothetical protein [Clostridiales bacterium]